MSEILILCHGLIFAVTNHFIGEENYEANNPIFYEVIKFDYLLPFDIVLILWIFSNIVLLVGTKIVFAPLVLPHLVIQIPAILSGVVLVVACIVNITNVPRVNWELLVSLSVFLLYTLAEIYFCFVIYACYKYLKVTRVQVAVQKTVLKTAEYQSSDDEETEKDKTDDPKTKEKEKTKLEEIMEDKEKSH
ncbi:MAG: hypothetical protein GY696_28440 [Gammaproteobacteria bacterium]|nr:hypothetical protein [Gammaproteobacteria bacterium]